MSTILERTGWALGDDEEVRAHDEVFTSQHTPVLEVSDPDLKDVLDEFDAAFVPPMAVLGLLRHPTEWSSTPAGCSGRVAVGFSSPFDAWDGRGALLHQLTTVVSTVRPPDDGDDDPVGRRDAVETIESLQSDFDLPTRDICRAAGVSRSAFYTWMKPGGPHPRVSSVMRLWGLVQFFQDLHGLLDGPPRDWLTSDELRYQQFLAGEFDELIQSIRRTRQAAEEAPAYTRLLHVGADRLESDEEPASVHSGSRKAVPARAAAPPRRRRQ